MKVVLNLVFLVALLFSTSAWAQEPLPPLGFKGYGDLQFAFYDHGPDQNREGGAQKDRRLTFDTARFVFEMTGQLPFEVEFEAELELEHGGTGAALELEYEEFGEFETEVEKGGEVLLEELVLSKTLADRFSLYVGRFYVAMGLLSAYHRPLDYLATTRTETETTLIPGVWDEMGAGFGASFGPVRTTLQLVNGLDSTGFSSQRWIALGHQRRYELVRATDLAVVGRVDVFPVPGVVAGVSSYFGGTSRNRPKPDLVKDCPMPDAGEIAPCGWVDAPLLIVDAHARVELGQVRASGVLLWGHLSNADDVSARNERLSNEVGVLRSPVSNQALGAWGEVGLNVGPWIGLPYGHKLEPYARVDYVDTIFRPRDGLFDNPRFERTIFTGGAGYTLGAVVAKLDLSHRRFGSDDLRSENTLRFSVGFVY